MSRIGYSFLDYNLHIFLCCFLNVYRSQITKEDSKAMNKQFVWEEIEKNCSN